MKRYCFALDLKDDASLIEEYELHHKNVWPEIKASIIDSGIVNLDIFRTGNRLFMIIEANESFSLKEKANADAQNPQVQKWEQLMWKYQQALPNAKKGEKWVLMENIFSLKSKG
jgi:L-rhamnose mutarotase